MGSSRFAFYIILYLLVLNTSSCRRDNSSGSNSPPVRCNYSFYLNKLFSSDPLQPSLPVPETTFFSLLENHSFTINNSDNPNVLGTSDIPSTCKSECSDYSLNSIYESFLAVNVLQNKEMNKKISPIFIKIFRSMESALTPSVFNSSVNSWANLNDSEIVFPSLQRQELFSHASQQLPTKEDAMKYALGLKTDSDNKSNPFPSNGLQLDYLLYNAKASDHIGLLTVRKEFKEERDFYFNGFARRMRGYRDNKEPYNKTLYYGIARFDIPELKAPPQSIPWRNWGRDSCINETQINNYTNAVYYLQIPLVCGISGTTNLALWSLFAYGAELDETEMRLFLLSIWATLSTDTGHALQEVLSSAKLAAIYLRGLIEYHDPAYNYFKNSISRKTLESLEKITQTVRPLGNSSENKGIVYWNSLFDKIYKINLSAPKPFRSYQVIGSEVPSNQFDAAEINVRKEIEYFFNEYDIVKSTGAQFGKYNDSFFSKIQNDDFTKARNLSQQKLKDYYKRSCISH